MLENMEATSTTKFWCSWVMEHTQKETLILHTWLLHKSPSVGEGWWESRVPHTKGSQKKETDDVSLVLLKKRKKGLKKNIEKKESTKRKERKYEKKKIYISKKTKRRRILLF